MSNVLVTVAVTTTPLPTGIVFGHTNLDITDSAGAKQTVVLTGSETPPWSAVVAVADGQMNAVATAVDSTGETIGSPITGTFSAGTVAATFSAPSAISFTQM
jgi:hypothetical protein